MSLVIEKFVRKPFDIDAVLVTDENIEDAAKWCGGDVRTDKNKAKYIKVRVVRPLTPRQSEAYVGDRILYAGTGYKVYTPRAFEAAFEPAESESSLDTGDSLIAVQDQDDEPEDIPSEPLKPYEGDVLNPFPAETKAV